MKQFLRFHIMLTPWMVEVLFWLGLVTCISASVVQFIYLNIWRGIGILVLGPIIIRIMCELIIIVFRIHDTLKDIAHNQDVHNGKGS